MGNEKGRHPHHLVNKGEGFKSQGKGKTSSLLWGRVTESFRIVYSAEGSFGGLSFGVWEGIPEYQGLQD